MSDEPVTRAMFDGRLHPILRPQRLAQLPECVWSEEDWEQIVRGFRARGMDQRWHVLAEGDTVFLHRSWTGFGVYAVTFAPIPAGGRRIVQVEVESDPERYRRASDLEECTSLEFVLSAVLLKKTDGDLRERVIASTRRKTSGDAAPGSTV